ncbi:MAG: sugar ABC transporter permease [Caldilineaceae bacterium]|nr:sugar ABC transporter permease [Caldilineaceae bacterium]
MAAKLSGLQRKEELAGYLFILPNLIGFLVFLVFPILAAVYLTFTEWELSSAPEFAGLANFRAMIGDDIFLKAFGNTFYYAFVAVPTGVFLAFVVALGVNRPMRGVFAFRLIYFLPHVTLTVAAAIVWAWIYHPEFGIINYLLSLIGIQGPNWLFNSKSAMPALIIMSNWKGVGYAMLIFLAGLQGVPAELYEAAVMDGANGWYRLVKITIPMLSPTTFFVLTTSFIGAFQGFDQFYIMTNGGPSFATTTLVLHIFNNGFRYFKMGYASSMAFVLFLCILCITLIQWTSARTWVHGFTQD